MTALLIVLGFSAHEIGQLVLNTPFESLVSLDPMQMLRVLTEGSLGLDPGHVLRQWLATQISRKTTCDIGQAHRLTLGELKTKTGMGLVCVAARLDTRKEFVLSSDATPDVPVVDAVQASMALPPLFQPVEVQGVLCSDGGLVNNFPVNLFDESRVFGIRLTSTPQTIADVQAMRLPLIGFVNFVLRILTSTNDETSFAEVSQNLRMTRIITISCGKVSTIESDVDSVKGSLFDAGVVAVEKFTNK
jgi:predicted acylesterase/phospholipase RssA